MQSKVPFMFMRGGTSRGPFFLEKDLPSRINRRQVVESILLRSLTPMIDSIAGPSSVTTKAAIVTKSERSDADVDMHFAQIDSEKKIVDWTPLCGNMLSAVVPFALENKIIDPTEGSDFTNKVVFNGSTGALVDVKVCTPNSQITYDGNCEISGVEGTGSPIELKFRQIEGAKTGQILPTNNVKDTLSNGIDVTILDIATPIMFVKASDFNLTSYEPEDQLSKDEQLLSNLLKMREEVKQKMVPFKGSDNPKSVLPKIVLVGKPFSNDSQLSARYFTPWACHPSYAVGGAVCTAAAAALPGSVVNEVVNVDKIDWNNVKIEHPSGSITAALDVSIGSNGDEFRVKSGGCVRTARKIIDGHIYVPNTVWDGTL